MRLMTFSFAAALVATLAAATPALADGARVEVYTGATWGSQQDTNADIGGRVGYDFNLGPNAFTGVEASVDKTLAHGYDTSLGLTGRLGLKPTPKDKLYALAGYSFNGVADSTHVGAGWEHNFIGPVYGSVEYRHAFTTLGLPDSNAMTAGVGLHF